MYSLLISGTDLTEGSIDMMKEMLESNKAYDEQIITTYTYQAGGFFQGSAKSEYNCEHCI